MQPPSSDLWTKSVRFIRQINRRPCECPESPRWSDHGKDHAGFLSVLQSSRLESDNRGTPRSSRATSHCLPSGRNELCSWPYCTGCRAVRGVTEHQIIELGRDAARSRKRMPRERTSRHLMKAFCLL